MGRIGRLADHEVDGQDALALGRWRAVDQADQRLGADPAELGARVLDGRQGRPNVPEGFNTMMQDGFQAVLAGIKTPAEQVADLEKAWEDGRK